MRLQGQCHACSRSCAWPEAQTTFLHLALATAVTCACPWQTESRACAGPTLSSLTSNMRLSVLSTSRSSFSPRDSTFSMLSLMMFFTSSTWKQSGCVGVVCRVVSTGQQPSAHAATHRETPSAQKRSPHVGSALAAGRPKLAVLHLLHWHPQQSSLYTCSSVATATQSWRHATHLLLHR